MRLTYDSLYAFLFVFFYVYIMARTNRDHHPQMVGLVVLALILAGSLILIDIALRDSRKRRLARHSLYVFVLLFLHFLFRLWMVSSYHPIPNPELWAFVLATIAAIAESFRADSGRSSAPKK
jgi:hypothetical protein